MLPGRDELLGWVSPWGEAVSAREAGETFGALFDFPSPDPPETDRMTCCPRRSVYHEAAPGDRRGRAVGRGSPWRWVT